MKRILLSQLILCLYFFSQGQIVINNGAFFIVKSNTEVIAKDGFTADNGSIENQGTITNLGDLINNTSALFTSNSTGTFIFKGTTMLQVYSASGNKNSVPPC